MRAKDLTQEQREEFQMHFYEIDGSPNDYDVGTLWGCPWDFGSMTKLKGNNLKEMAYNYFLDVEDEIMIEQIKSLISGSDYIPLETEIELHEAVGRLTLSEEQARHIIKTFLNSTSNQ